MDSSKYVPLCQVLVNRVRFSAPSPQGSPAGSPFDDAQMIPIVRTKQPFLPATYQQGFAAPLIAALPALAGQLRQRFEEDQQQQGMSEPDAMADVKSISDSLVGAVRDWGVKEYQGPVRRFEAVVSNLFRSFLGAEQRAKASLPLIEVLPPLVTFAPTAEAGPFTWPADAVKEFIKAPIAVVSLPGSYREHPLLWPALAHETGGHDVLHADTGLLGELAHGVTKLAGVPKAIGKLWASWIDETASDVYGLLNIGPAFGVSLAAFFAALQFSDPRKDPQLKLGTIGSILPVAGGKLLDPHPVDILRLYLAMGVVGALRGLSAARRQQWLALLRGVAGVAGGGVTSIRVVDVSTRPPSVVQQLPLAAMGQVAQAVGAFIATGKFHALKGHSIQDIETWDDPDEDAAVAIAAAVAGKKSIVALGDDAQLLAGTTMAVLDAPAKYADITRALDAALDDSFARDPIFGKPTPHMMRARTIGDPRRGRADSRTPAPPPFPLAMPASTSRKGPRRARAR